MKKKLIKIFALSMTLSMLFGLAVFAQTESRQYVFDPVYLLDDTQYYELNVQATEISERYGCAVHFVVTDDPYVNMDNIQQYSEDLYLESPKLGYGDGKDGVMLVLGTYDRCYWLLAYGEKGNYAFTDYAKDMMAENFLDNFAQDDWYGGFSDYIADCGYVLGEAEKGTPVDIYYTEEDIGAEGYVIALLVGAIAAFVICGIFKSKMKTANIATRAAVYLDKNNANITERHQIFTHSTVTRTKIESESSDRGGTTVNSRGFSGKGGKF